MIRGPASASYGSTVAIWQSNPCSWSLVPLDVPDQGPWLGIKPV